MAALAEIGHTIPTYLIGNSNSNTVKVTTATTLNVIFTHNNNTATIQHKRSEENIIQNFWNEKPSGKRKENEIKL